MTAISVERAKDGYRLGKDEGEAYWLLGMLEIVKISGADTGGEFGLLEVTVRAGEGSPWHVHPERTSGSMSSKGSSRSTSARNASR
jgi:quercetin dioxygenase-like cupin family protein